MTRLRSALLFAVVVATLVSARAAQRLRAQPELGEPRACAAYAGLPNGWPADPAAGMVRVAGGTVTVGSRRGYREEQPGGSTQVDAFLIDRTEVTNAQFAAFVEATGYVSVAERRRVGAVFHRPSEEELAEEDYPWWQGVEGADWRHPEGPTSDLRARANRPVVQVAYDDALAYARWLGNDLPTEAEWEHAARARRSDDALSGAPRDAAGRFLANFWQGTFPTDDRGEDGYASYAPVGCFPANPNGLYDTVGNVWEWTRDVWRGSHAEAANVAVSDTPDARRVIKGGSFLCSQDFCARYRVSARHPEEPAMSTGHLGFRTVRRRR